MMMKSNYFLFLFLLLNFTSACARFRPLNSSINVTTDKQAKVSLWEEKTEKAQELGTTPFQSSYKELFEKSGDAEWISLIVSAPGFVSENIIVPRAQASALNIQIKLITSKLKLFFSSIGSVISVSSSFFKCFSSCLGLVK